jgi:threonine dehydratase
MALMHELVAAAYERIRSSVRETPVDESKALAEGGTATVFLKLEHLQHTGSFKFRGASIRSRF